MVRSLTLVLIACIGLASPALAQEEDPLAEIGGCDVIPANPLRLAPADAPNPELAYELSEYGFAAAEAEDFLCAAFFNLKAFEAEPDPILLFNSAKALERAGFKDASLRYAKHFVQLSPVADDRASGEAIIARLEPILSAPDHAELDLTMLGASSVVLGWVRYEPGDRPRLPRGPHELLVERPGQEPVTEVVDVPIPPPVVELPPPPPTWDLPMIAGVSSGGVGLVLIVVAIAIDLGLADEIQRYDQIGACAEGQEDPTLCLDRFGETDTWVDQYNDLGSGIETDAAAAIGLLATGSVLLAAGIGLVVYHFVTLEEPTLESDNAAAWSLGIAPRLDGGGEINLQLRF